VCGYHRKYAIRLLGQACPPLHPRTRGARRPAYAPQVIQALALVCESAGYPWSVRLKALLPLWLPWLRQRVVLTPQLERQVLEISPRQIDRRLRSRKGERRRRLHGPTKPGTLLKHQIPIKTDHWDITTLGFTEIDPVSHSGNCAEGEFAHSLNLTDTRGVHNQGSRIGRAYRYGPRVHLRIRRPPMVPSRGRRFRYYELASLAGPPRRRPGRPARPAPGRLRVAPAPAWPMPRSPEPSENLFRASASPYRPAAVEVLGTDRCPARLPPRGLTRRSSADLMPSYRPASVPPSRRNRRS
jgi:hypothetical protein